jgi:RimJ/RimL family protein N-acetyltransferase
VATLRTNDPSARPAPQQIPPVNAVSLKNETVTIAPLMPEDVGPLFIWLNDVDAARLDLAYRPTDWMAFKNWMDDLARNNGQVVFAIRKLFEPQIIGFVIFKNVQLVHRSAEIGLRIGAEAERGKGYGKRALALALTYAWNHLNLHRVSLTVFAHNARAIATYRAVGFQEEGRLKDGAFIDGEYVDVVLMAAIRPALRAQAQA